MKDGYFPTVVITYSTADCVHISPANRGADPRARRMGASLLADIRRAQSGRATCSGAKRWGKSLDGVSAAIPSDEVAGNASHHRQNKVAERSGAALFCPSACDCYANTALSSRASIFERSEINWSKFSNSKLTFGT